MGDRMCQFVDFSLTQDFLSVVRLARKTIVHALFSNTEHIEGYKPSRQELKCFLGLKSGAVLAILRTVQFRLMISVKNVGGSMGGLSSGKRQLRAVVATMDDYCSIDVHLSRCATLCCGPGLAVQTS